MGELNFEKKEESKMGKNQPEPVYIRTVIEKMQRANTLLEILNNEFYSANARLGCASPLSVTEEKCLDIDSSSVVDHINEQLDRFFGNIYDYDRRVNELKEFV